MKNYSTKYTYSTEYTGVLAMLIAPYAGTYFSDACAGEVSGVVATGIISGVSALYLLAKRYQRGKTGTADAVTPLGFRK